MADGYSGSSVTMPTEVYEEPLSLEIDELEAIPLSMDIPKHRLSYPFPYLVKTGKRKSMEFLAVIIENDCVRATVLPQLGGRILRLQHKKSGKQVLGDSDKMYVAEGGPRGAHLPTGIRWASFPYIKEDLAPVEYLLVQPTDDESAGGIRMSSLFYTTTRDLIIGLDPTESRLQVEFLNYERSYIPDMSAPHIRMEITPGAKQFSFRDGEAVYSESVGHGVAVSFDRNLVRHARMDGSQLIIGSHQGLGHFQQGHTLDRFTCSIAPLVGLERVTSLSNDATIELNNDRLSVCSNISDQSAKVFLQLANGATVEASIVMAPGNTVSFPLSALSERVTSVAMFSQGNESLRWRVTDKWRQPKKKDKDVASLDRRGDVAKGFEKLLKGENPEAEFEFATKDFKTRFHAFLGLGIHALRNQQYNKAADLFEQALLYNGEDHLAWWMRAAALRLGGETSEECPELLNAHYLSPLDPILRAESFFRQPIHEQGPSALLNPLADNPEAFIEVAWLLHDCKVYPDLSSWVNEALKFREIPMLRYIIADALLQGSNMKTEAAHHITVASKTPINPPYPTRKSELELLKRLNDLFPDDKRIGELLALMRRATRPWESES